MVLLEGGGIHRHKHIAAVAGCVYAVAYTDLKARYTAE
jgi:hypothetical protein